MSDMSYVDAQVQDTTPFSNQSSFGSFIIGPKTVGKSRDVAASASTTATSEGLQSVIPTAAKKGSAFGPESELAMPGEPVIAPPVNWLGIGALALAGLTLLVVLLKRR